MPQDFVNFVRDIYSSNGFIPLHSPQFLGKEKEFVLDTINSTFVSSVGQYVDRFEAEMATYTGSKNAVATVNGTAALYTALYLSGVNAGDLVITQSLTFVATCNAIHMLGAAPVFVDVDSETLGMSPTSLSTWLEENAFIDDLSVCRCKKTNQPIKAIVPMHTFGHPTKMDELMQAAEFWQLEVIEDAAESLGSFYKTEHTGLKGRFGILSFNGNKIITTGGGGMLLCQSEDDARRAKHVTTTAKVPHQYEFYHDEPGFNYRMPNINAALGCGQLEQINKKLEAKRKLANIYSDYFLSKGIRFVKEPRGCESNYWLNTIALESTKEKEEWLKITNESGIMTRGVWQLMSNLPMYENCIKDELKTSKNIYQTHINLPSTPVSIA